MGILLLEVCVDLSEIGVSGLLLLLWLGLLLEARALSRVEVLIGRSSRTKLFHEIVIADCGHSVGLL